MSLLISAYKTDDGFVFEDAQIAKEHDYWLQMRVLAEKIPAPASSEPVKVLTRQRTTWLVENAKQIVKLAKYATDHRDKATNAADPNQLSLLEGDDAGT